MNLKRRAFLQAATIAGLSLIVPTIVRKKASAEATRYDGPYWIFVNAGGGWDPTTFCDPKGGKTGDRDTVNMNYAPSAIKTTAGIAHAPLSYSLPDAGNAPLEVYSVQRFFAANASRFTVLNGVDTTTNNHDTGTRITWSGLTQEGTPALAALIAAIATESLTLPMPFLSYGGYDQTANVTTLTRAGEVNSLVRLAYPQRMDASKADSPTYVTPTTAERIQRAQEERLRAMRDRQTLPYTRASMNQLYLSRTGNDGLPRLAAELGQLKQVSVDDFADLKNLSNDSKGQLGGMIDMMRQTQVALSAFKAGVAVSANLEAGYGFDTHSGHDDNHPPRLIMLLRAVDYILQQAQAMGISDRVNVVVGSDFGRTPYYNSGNGKDHWNITSMLVSSPQNKNGGKVIGSTDAGFRAVGVNPSTLAADAAAKPISSTHVHRALRRLAKIDAHPIAQRFGLPGDDLPLFG